MFEVINIIQLSGNMTKLIVLLTFMEGNKSYCYDLTLSKTNMFLEDTYLTCASV